MDRGGPRLKVLLEAKKVNGPLSTVNGLCRSLTAFAVVEY